jgi:Flp pilus assembly protein TadB
MRSATFRPPARSLPADQAPDPGDKFGENRRTLDVMGRVILLLIGAFLAVMVVLWALHALMALFWLAVVVAIVVAVARLAFWSGRRSRSSRR